jgi:5-methylcytosine-specific restriction endonuclease McrA
MDVSKELMATGHWGELQVELGLLYDFRCGYCYKDLIADADSHRDWQQDHLIPSSRDGTDEIGNLVLCCRTCNHFKGKWNPAEHLNGLEQNKDNMTDIARVYINSRREALERDVQIYRQIVRR